MKLKSISVIVVTFNSSKYVRKCLESILNSKNISLEVIVIDNASSDSTIEIIENFSLKDNRIKLIKLKKNVGFPLACNIGVLHARSKYIAFVNPDVMVDSQCFARLVDVLDNDQSIAVVQPKLLNPKGFIDSAGGLTDLLGHGFHIGMYESDKKQYDKLKNIFYACFACAVVRKDIFIELGGLDPYYFLYNEDLDFSWRCWLAGYRVVYVPNALAYHFGQHSTKKLPLHAIYFNRRNRLYTVFSNYPILLAIGISIILLIFYIGLGIVSSINNKIEARLMIRVFSKFFRDVKYLVKKRTKLIRKRGFIWIIRSSLIDFRFIGLRLYLAKLYRRLLG